MIVLKKQTLSNLAFCFVLIFSAVINFFPEHSSFGTAAPVTNGKIIVIDPGHVTPDGGATGSGGTLEKDLNLDVAKRLGSYFQQSGAYVVYTREDDNAVCEDLTDKIKNIKRTDLKNRKNIKNNSNADVFISIHMNKFEDSRYSGAQVFYQNDSHSSKTLAECVQKSLRQILDTSNTREAKNAHGSIFILKDNTLPSVLVECGFLSNPEEEALLGTASYRDKIAFAIFGGVSLFLSNNS